MRLALPPNSCKVPTPPDLAEAMVNALGDKPQAQWLEPSHGTGVFLEALAKRGVPKDRISAVDLDPVAYPADSLAQTSRRQDFLRWAAETELRFDRIIGNPPYISIKRLKPSLRKSASSVLNMDGKPIGNGANVWYAFVITSIRLLNEGGTLAFVLPSSAEFANYSSVVRESISKSFGRLELYRCTRSLFENVQEGTLVAIARDYKGQSFKYRKQTFPSREALIQGLLKGGEVAGRKCPSVCVPKPPLTVKFSNIAKIRLGGVTGDASYFLMNEERRVELGLPATSLTKVVSKAKQLKFSTIDNELWNELKKSGERIWLFNPDDSEINHEAVEEYLKLKPENGGCNKEAFKISIREPWYRIPLPETADAFLSGMSQSGPWLTINAIRGLSATNTLYVVSFNSRDRGKWYMWALSMLTSHAQKQISRAGRLYTDGLIKYEPGSIGQIELPILKEGKQYKSLYDKAITSLLSSDLGAVKDIADSARL